MNDSVMLAIRKAICACFGIESDSAEALSLVREAYTEPENTPRPARNTDVIYWYLSPEYGQPPPAYNVAGELNGSHTPLVTQTLFYRLLVVCYGPYCESYSQRIRALFFVDGKGFPREILRKAGVFPVPDPPPVEKLYEPEGSLWRHRADLSITLQVVDTITSPNRRGAIETPPAVIINR